MIAGLVDELAPELIFRNVIGYETAAQPYNNGGRQ